LLLAGIADGHSMLGLVLEVFTARAGRRQYHPPMASCGTCGAEGLQEGQPCPRCGSMPAPELALDVKPRAPAAKPARRREVIEEMPLELAIDPRALVQERAAEGSSGHAPHTSPSPGHAAPPASGPQPAAPAAKRPPSMAPGPMELHADAAALADYGEAPGSWVTSPLYAWRVLRRQRELKAALAVRRAEAEHAQTAVEDALVAFAERVRGATEKHKDYAALHEELTRAEDVLRSRDKVLAAEQDAQRARLAQVDGRVAKAEAELAQAQGQERAVATELAGVQGALAREEAKLKRAELELRNAQQREGGGKA
jgi:hypothetical protein